MNDITRSNLHLIIDIPIEILETLFNKKKLNYFNDFHNKISDKNSNFSSFFISHNSLKSDYNEEFNESNNSVSSENSENLCALAVANQFNKFVYIINKTYNNFKLKSFRCFFDQLLIISKTLDQRFFLFSIYIRNLHLNRMIKFVIERRERELEREKLDFKLRKFRGKKTLKIKRGVFIGMREECEDRGRLRNRRKISLLCVTNVIKHRIKCCKINFMMRMRRKEKISYLGEVV